MQQSPSQSKRTFWERRVVDVVLAQFKQGITPDKIALTIALGVSLGLFPIFGTTTILCLIVAFWLRLNQPIIHLINQLLWPVHVLAVVFFVKWGQQLFHVPHTPLNFIALNHMLWHDPSLFVHKFGSTALHAIVAWLICAPFISLTLYFVTLHFIFRPLAQKMAALHAEAAAREAAARAAKGEYP